MYLLYMSRFSYTIEHIVLSIDRLFYYAYNHYMGQKKAVSVGFIMLGVLALFMFFDYKNNVNRTTISANILYLTQPVTSFTGVVEKKEGNKIIVSQTVLSIQNPRLSPTPVKLTYTFLVSKNTSFLRPPVNITFLFTTPPPLKEKKYQLDNITVGSTVTISVLTDLRSLKQPVFEAHNIFLTAAVNTFTGKIIDKKEGVIIIDTPKNEKVQVYVTDQTEISRYVFTPPVENQPLQPVRPERMSFKDLTDGMQVAVYTDKDILTEKNLTAVRIEPIILPKATVTASPAAQMITANP